MLNKPCYLLQTPLSLTTLANLCLYSIKNLKYYSNLWFIYSVCPSVCEWNAIDSLIFIPNILFNSFVNFTVNWDSLLPITPFSNLCNFYTLSLNNLANPFTNVPSAIATKCAIFGNQSYTTKITSFSATNSNLVIKSTIKYIYIFSSISFIIKFSASVSVLFFILWYKLYLSTYFLTSLVTSGH